MIDDRASLAVIRRLPGTGDANRHLEPSGREANAAPVRAQARPWCVSAPPTLQPLILTPCRDRWSQNACASASSAFSVITADSGMTGPPKL